MSVAAARWASKWLREQRRPKDGGPSHAYRAVLSTLARDADARRHVARTSAATIAEEHGYSERHVRRMFDLIELDGWARRTPRPGRSDLWQMPAIVYPQPRTSDVRGRLSTPRTLTARTPDIGDTYPGHLMSDEGLEGFENRRGVAQ